jgi:hypothetical protein
VPVKEINGTMWLRGVHNIIAVVDRSDSKIPWVHDVLEVVEYFNPLMAQFLLDGGRKS